MNRIEKALLSMFLAGYTVTPVGKKGFLLIHDAWIGTYTYETDMFILENSLDLNKCWASEGDSIMAFLELRLPELYKNIVYIYYRVDYLKIRRSLFTILKEAYQLKK